MKIRIGDDGILMKTVNGKEWPVNCSQSLHAKRTACGVDCAHCNEGIEQRVNQNTGQILAARKVVILGCTLQATSLPLEDPIVQTLPPGTIIKEN